MKVVAKTLMLILCLGGSIASAQDRPAPAAPEETGDTDAPPGAPTDKRVTTETPSGNDGTEDKDLELRRKKQDRISKISARFFGSIFLFDQSITPETVSQGAQLSPIPSYQWWFSLRPRFYIKPNLSLRVRMDLTVEWLNGGANTTYNRQPLFGDLWMDVAYTLPVFAGIRSTVSARTVWGTSLDAQSSTSVLRAGPVLSFVRPFRTKIGEIEPSLGLYALYNFAQKTQAGVQGDGYGCTSTDYTPTVCSQNGGLSNAQAGLVAVMGLRYSPISKVSINADYIVLDSWAFNTPDAVTIDQSGGTQVIPRSANDNRFRQSGWFLASVDYDPTSYLDLSLGFYTLRSIRNPDGGIGDPFYHAGGDTRVFFTTTFNLDKVYETIARKVTRNTTVSRSRDLASAK